MARMRTALVGCGKVGGIHARALAELAGSELAGVCDSDLARAEGLAARLGTRAFDRVESMLAACAPEVVAIATPHPLHAGAAVAAMDGGAHVIVEKPLAVTVADCDRMLAAARANGVLLSVISQRRWYTPVLRMKAAIDAGKLGRPVLGVFTMYSWRSAEYYLSDPWRGRWDSEGGGVLVNQSPHMLDLLEWLMGDHAESVCGFWGNLNHPSVEVEDTAVAAVRFRSGGLASITTSLAQKPGIHTKVHIHGSNGASVGVETDRGATFIAGVSTIAEPPLCDLWTIPGEEQRLAAFQAEDRAAFAAVDSEVHYHKLQLADFLAAIRDGRAPLVTAEDGKRTVALFQAIYRSNNERRVVALGEA